MWELNNIFCSVFFFFLLFICLQHKTLLCVFRFLRYFRISKRGTLHKIRHWKSNNSKKLKKKNKKESAIKTTQTQARKQEKKTRVQKTLILNPSNNSASIFYYYSLLCFHYPSFLINDSFTCNGIYLCVCLPYYEDYTTLHHYFSFVSSIVAVAFLLLLVSFTVVVANYVFEKWSLSPALLSVYCFKRNENRLNLEYNFEKFDLNLSTLK